MGPPPTTMSVAGSVAMSKTSRLVQYGVPAAPGTSGRRGRVPVPTTTRVPRMRSPPTSTVRGATNRPRPRKSVTFLPSEAAIFPSVGRVAAKVSARRAGPSTPESVARRWKAPASRTRVAASA